MWPFRKKTRLTIDEYLEVWREARNANMVELGLLPQSHLTRSDKEANLKRLQNSGHEGVGRAVAAGQFREDRDLTARDN